MWVATTDAPAAAAARQVVLVGEAADVVAQDGAGGEGCRGDGRAPGVDADGHVEARGQAGDRGDHALELFGLAHLGPRPGAHAAHVEQVGAVGDERLGAREERVEVEGRRGLVERVGGAVEDPHDERPRRQVEAAVPEAQGDRRARAVDPH